MKKIPEIELPGAETLTPMQMNAIPLDAGTHSSLRAEAPATPRPANTKTS